MLNFFWRKWCWHYISWMQMANKGTWTERSIMHHSMYLSKDVHKHALSIDLNHIQYFLVSHKQMLCETLHCEWKDNQKDIKVCVTIRCLSLKPSWVRFQSSSWQSMAAPRLTQCWGRLLVGNIMEITKLVEWPVVERVPLLSLVL